MRCFSGPGAGAEHRLHLIEQVFGDEWCVAPWVLDARKVTTPM